MFPLSKVKMLASLLPERVGSPLSLTALSEDLEVAYSTVKRWLSYLEELYYVFFVIPYTQKLVRSIKKERKYYLWDWSEIPNTGSWFENIIASHLLKYCHYLTDTGEGTFELNYVRNKQKQEVDFLLVKNQKPWFLVECKLNHQNHSDHFSKFMSQLNCSYGIQVCETSNVYEYNQTAYGKRLSISADRFLGMLV